MLIKISYFFLIYLCVLFSLNLINSNEIENRNSTKNSKESTAVEKKSDLINFNYDGVNNKSENQIVSINGAQQRTFNLFLNKTTQIANENYTKDPENYGLEMLTSKTTQAELETPIQFRSQMLIENLKSEMEVELKNQLKVTNVKLSTSIQNESNILTDNFKNNSSQVSNIESIISDSAKLFESEVLTETDADVKLKNDSATMTILKPKSTIQIESEISYNDFKNHSKVLQNNSRKIIPKLPPFNYGILIKKIKNKSANVITSSEIFKDEYVKNNLENVDVKTLTQNDSNMSQEEFTNISIIDSARKILNEQSFSNNSVIKLCQNSSGTELKESFNSELKNISKTRSNNTKNIETLKNTEICKKDSNIESEKRDLRNSSEIELKNSTQIDTKNFTSEIPNKNDSNIPTIIPNENGREILKNISSICGGQLTRRISFGVETTLLQYPWSALLVYNTTERYHCGATLITHQYVLTAAHCVSQYYYPLIAVRLGEHNLTSEIDCAPSLTGEPICNYNTFDIGIERVIIHEGFSRRHYKNDISLLRLEYAIQFSNAVNPICLPQFKAFEEISRLTRGTVTGWGATEKSLHSNVLMQADIPILNISKCHEIYRRSFNESLEICASGANEVDVCKGDSGGPLFRREYLGGRREKFVQVGIISLGALGCGDERFLPAVFTRVLAYMHWIEDNLYY